MAKDSMNVPMIFITSNSLPFLFLIQLSHAIFQVAEVSFQTVELNSENKNEASVIQITAHIWMQEGKRAVQISILVIIHLPPLEYGKIKDQKFGTKLISRINVNTSFPDMEGKAVAPQFSCLLSLDEELQDHRYRTAGIDEARKHLPTYIYSQMEEI